MEADKPKKTNKHLRRFFHVWHNPIAEELIIAFFIGFAVAFITLGFVINSKNQNGFYYEFDYTDYCRNITNCVLPSFSLPTNFNGPLFVQYKVTNFGQNNYHYTISIPNSMLIDGLGDPTSNSNCLYYTTNANFSKIVSANNTPLNQSAFAMPCGWAAFTLFTDNFQLVYDSGMSNIPISGSGIAWSTDIQYRAVNIDLSKQWIDFKNERFVNWMRTPPYDKFIKTWGQISGNIGTSPIKFQVNNIWSVNLPKVRKSIILTSVEWYGSPNNFLVGFFISFGFFSLLFGIGLIINYIHKKATYKKPVYQVEEINVEEQK